MHFTGNKIENNHDLKNIRLAKTSHLPNQTGTDKAYHPNKDNEQIKKKYTIWKN